MALSSAITTVVSSLDAAELISAMAGENQCSYETTAPPSQVITSPTVNAPAREER